MIWDLAGVVLVLAHAGRRHRGILMEIRGSEYGTEFGMYRYPNDHSGICLRRPWPMGRGTGDVTTYRLSHSPDWNCPSEGGRKGWGLWVTLA